MNMSRFFCVIAAVLTVAGTSQAGVLSSLLTFNGQTDQIGATNSTSVNVLDIDTSGGFSLGDVFYGFVEFSNSANDLLAPPPPTSSGQIGDNALVIAFSAEILGYDSVNDVFSFGAVTDTDLSVKSLLGSVVGKGSLLDTDIVAALGFPNGGPPEITGNFAETVTPFGAYTAGDIPDGLKNFGASWNVELAGDLSGTDDFLQYSNSTNSQSGGLTARILPGFPGGTQLIPVPTTLPYPGLTGTPTGSASDLSLELTSVNSKGLDGWSFQSQSRFRLNAVPEPSSVLAFAGMVGCVGFVRRRRS
jgi:hypothetical protein